MPSVCPHLTTAYIRFSDFFCLRKGGQHRTSKFFTNFVPQSLKLHNQNYLQIYIIQMIWRNQIGGSSISINFLGQIFLWNWLTHLYQAETIITSLLTFTKVIIHKSHAEQFLLNINWDLGWFWQYWNKNFGAIMAQNFWVKMKILNRESHDLALLSLATFWFFNFWMIKFSIMFCLT